MPATKPAREAPPRPAPAAPDRAEAQRQLQRRLEGLFAASEAKARDAALSCHPSASDLRVLEDRLAAGAQDGAAKARGSRRVEVVLGVDFGTTSTKLVARLPYEAGSPAFAVPVPAFAQAESHPYLWASRLWLAPDGGFSLAPRPHAEVFCAIKANLMAASTRTDPLVAASSSGAGEVVPGFRTGG